MKLQELRKERKISQQELANELNINVMTYNNWEKEKREPNIETLIKLADFYNVTIDYLIGRDYSNDVGYLSDAERELLNNFKQLKPLNQIKILAEIKGILIAQD